MTQLLTDLRALRAYFGEGPHRWTQGTDARDSYGRSVGAFEPHAVCHCLIGGNNLVIGPCYGVMDEDREAWMDRRRELAEALAAAISPDYSVGLVAFNDDRYRTHADIVTVIDRAIETEESKLETAS